MSGTWANGLLSVIGGSRGGLPHPLWDPILSFLHTFSPKSAHVGGPCPPQWVHAPPMGNPGSATVSASISFPITQLMFIKGLIQP